MMVVLIGKKKRAERRKCGPSRRMIATLSIIAAIVIGTIIFGAVTTTMSSRTGLTGTILNQLTRPRRDATSTNNTHPEPRNQTMDRNPEVLIERARQQLKEAEAKRVTLHNEREPIPIWAEQAVGVTINQKMVRLEGKSDRAIKYLEFGKVSMTRCLSLWGPKYEEQAESLCDEAVGRLDTRW